MFKSKNQYRGKFDNIYYFWVTSNFWFSWSSVSNYLKTSWSL
jgi:hypothetical protein